MGKRIVIDFDQLVDRNTAEDIKYGKIEGIDDLIPMWVADMDFRSPAEVRKALSDISMRGIYGYSEADSSYDKALTEWFSRRPHCQIPIKKTIDAITSDNPTRHSGTPKKARNFSGIA